MNAPTKVNPIIVRPEPGAPIFTVTGDAIALKAGTQINGVTRHDATAVMPPEGGFTPGVDYAIRIDAAGGLTAVLADAIPRGDAVLGGFHYAPGSNATARTGGSSTPALNPHSVWDAGFRPACDDPRGMTLVTAPGGRFWCDIYLTGADHLDHGTSRFGITIADGVSLPQKPGGGRFKRCDYETARAIMQHHGKQLLGAEEFFAAAFGVLERTSQDDDPKVTGLDAERTSKWGVMQATGGMWVWGNDGDPDDPRASLFGGSWMSGGNAGSRFAGLGDWPGSSDGGVGARGRCDHLQLD